MLDWSRPFGICSFLDNHHYASPHHSQECILAAGAAGSLTASAGNAFEQLRLFSAQHHDWLFGHFAYDLKNETERLQSSHPDLIGFPDLFFFVPEVIIILGETTMQIGCLGQDPALLFEQLSRSRAFPKTSENQIAPRIESRFSKEEYLSTVEKLKAHILRGDCYEVNFCQEFFARNAVIDPYLIYQNLSRLSPTPFGGFYRVDEKYVLCASPERYLKKTGATILSQPIKGTSKREPANILADQQQKEALLKSAKERSENVMVVDLVRNDLSRVATQGSVVVDELYGLYSFPQVHQMISTVRGTVAEGMDWTYLIRETFPMGSMTGAPKKSVMQLIEQYEKSRRGVFSGAIGYVTPERDFDFNVVIRSILYNKATATLSYQVGSAITFYCDAEKEYEECQLKAAAIKKVLMLDQYP